MSHIKLPTLGFRLVDWCHSQLASGFKASPGECPTPCSAFLPSLKWKNLEFPLVIQLSSGQSLDKPAAKNRNFEFKPSKILHYSTCGVIMCLTQHGTKRTAQEAIPGIDRTSIVK